MMANSSDSDGSDLFRQTNLTVAQKKKRLETAKKFTDFILSSESLLVTFMDYFKSEQGVQKYKLVCEGRVSQLAPAATQGIYNIDDLHESVSVDLLIFQSFILTSNHNNLTYILKLT